MKMQQMIMQIVNIEKVTGDIEITVTANKIEIETTTPIVNIDSSATSSLEAKTQSKGTILSILSTISMLILPKH